MAHQITILGAGICGITTALHLQESGYQTLMIAPMSADQRASEGTPPSFASLYPAACIVPHSCEMRSLVDVFSQSQADFARLADDGTAGVRWQDHYEFLAGPEPPLPGFLKALRNVHGLRESPTGVRLMQAADRPVSGWGATVLFAEMAVYVPYLLKRYREAGGSFRRASMTREDIPTLGPVLVNCTGLWSRELFGDKALYPIRGELALCEGAPFPPGRDRLFSYNYTPLVSEYKYDVYFFPRTDGWLLGGSREDGVPDASGGWSFPGAVPPSSDGVPGPLLDLNRQILCAVTGYDFSGLPRKIFVGYRPARAGGVRLDIETVEGVPVVHNYGHGGGGVALSWGCARRVRSLIAPLV